MARGDEQLNRIFEQGLAGSTAEERQLMSIRDGLKSLKADVSCPVEFDDVMRRVRTESVALPAAKGGFRLPWMWGGTVAVAATLVGFAFFMARPQTSTSAPVASNTEPPLAAPTDTTADNPVINTESALPPLADQPLALGATDLDTAPTTTNNPVAALKREVASPRRSTARRSRPANRPAPAPAAPAITELPQARTTALPGNSEASGFGGGGGAPAMAMAADSAAKEESVPVVLISERSGPVSGQNAAFEVESDDVVFGG